MTEKIKRVTLSKNKVEIRQICKMLEEKCFIYFQNIMRKDSEEYGREPHKSAEDAAKCHGKLFRKYIIPGILLSGL